MKEEVYKTTSSSQTKKLGEDFVKRLSGKEFIAFYGNLGSGKTTFIQGLALGLGIKRRIISPTFIIVRSYRLKKNSFYHIDLYRTQNVNDLLTLGLDQIIEEDNIIALEWAEKMGNMLPTKRYEVHLNYLKDDSSDTREIKIIKYG